jgi:transposase
LEPAYRKRAGQSKLDGYEEALLSWLSLEQQKHRKQRKTLKQLYSALVNQGYEGSYDRVTAYARDWRSRHARSICAGRVFIPLRFKPGEAFQFDWSEEHAVIAWERVKLHFAHTRLCYSRVFMVQAYWSQSHEMLFDAHNHAFLKFEGVPSRGIYDNMKTAVDRVQKGKERQVNARFQTMASHYLFEPTFCTPASGWEKGQVEKSIQDVRRCVVQHAPACSSLSELNAWLEARCIALWHELKHPEQEHAIAEVWQEEKAYLMPVSRPFDGFVEHIKRVSPTSLIHLERNRYSVPTRFANQWVWVRVYAHRLVVVAQEKVIAERARVIDRSNRDGQTIYDWRDYLNVIQRKPGALRNGAPFAELPEAFKRMQTLLLKRPGGDREMAEILALVLHHDEQDVHVAVELALESGTPSKQHVLNILSRLVEETLPESVNAPQALTLKLEPLANVGRYDSLRETPHAV